MIRNILFTFIFVIISIFVNAQDSAAVAGDRDNTGLRAEGKIYVVLAVAVTILIGLLIYLVRLDRKIERLEKKN
jgi:hypothetical protein